MRLLSFFVFTELLYLTLILRAGEIVMGIDNLSQEIQGFIPTEHLNRSSLMISLEILGIIQTV